MHNSQITWTLKESVCLLEKALANQHGWFFLSRYMQGKNTVKLMGYGWFKSIKSSCSKDFISMELSMMVWMQD